MGTIYLSDDFYQLASMASRRARRDPRESVVAVVLAALSVEAFLNEIVEVAGSARLAEDRPEELSAAFALLKSLEARKAPIDLKLQLLHFVLTRRALEKGRQPYQDFDLLIGLRNALVHKKPESWDWPPTNPVGGYKPHEFVKRLSDRGVIPLPASDTPPIWQVHIYHPEVARWACSVAAQMVEFLVEMIPPGEIKQALQGMAKNLADDHLS